MTVHPIEVESYGIMRSRVDFTARRDGDRDVVERMVHATADESFATSTRIGVEAVSRAVAALRGDTPIVVDAAMVAAGITGRPTECYLRDVPTAADGSTRSAAAIRLAVERHPTGAVWVFGNAPTALLALLDLYANGKVDPAVVIGTPVGYVGAASAKDALWRSELRDRAITNIGERGGSAVAAAALNALVRLEERTQEC